MSPTKYYGILITLICVKLPKGSSKLEWNEVMNENDDVSDKIYHVEAVLGGNTHLPCDVEPSDHQKRVYMVLWFRQYDNRPIYSFDARGRGIGKELHSSDEVSLGPRAQFTVLTQPAGLHLENVQLNDEGVYRCRVDYSNAPTRNFEIHLTVTVPPHQMILYDHSGREIQSVVGPMHENTDLNLLCEVRGGNPAPNVTWSLDGQVLQNQTLVQDTNIVMSKLELKNLTRKYMDNVYTCTSSNTNLVAPTLKKVQLKLYMKPLTVTILEKHREFKVNQIYSLICETSGSKPTADISWWINDTLVNASKTLNNATGDASTQLIHYKFRAEDNNLNIRCEVTNPKIPNFKLEDSFKLNVRYPPFASLQLGNKLDSNCIKESDDVYFECRNRANPSSTKVIWFHNDRRIYQNISNGIILSGESLVLQSVSRLYSGLYRCQVTNDEGETASNSVQLRIRYAPVCRSRETVVVGTSLGDVVNVVCTVDADPAVTTFKWVLNNSIQSLVVPKEKYVVLNATTSMLGYKLISNRDFGTLTCRTSNVVGVQKTPCTFFVVKAGKYPYSGILHPPTCPDHNSTASYQPIGAPSQESVTASRTYILRVHPSAVTNCSFELIDENAQPALGIRCLPGYSGGIRQTFHAEIGDRNRTIFMLNVTEIPYFRIELWKLLYTLQSDTLQYTFYSSNAKGRSESVLYQQKLPQEWKSKLAESYILSKDGEKFVNVTLLVVAGSVAIILATLSLVILLVKRWYSLRKSIGCDREIKSAMTKINANANEEQFLISYQLEKNPKPDILNKVAESKSSSLVNSLSNGEEIAQRVPYEISSDGKYSIFVTTAGSRNEQAVTCKKLHASCDTLFGPESSV